MRTLLDEETVVLEALDFAPPCAVGDHAAQLLIGCRWCTAEALMCREHEKAIREHIEACLRVPGEVLICSECLHAETSYDALIRVVEI